jgi:hypothetical protein
MSAKTLAIKAFDGLSSPTKSSVPQLYKPGVFPSNHPFHGSTPTTSFYNPTTDAITDLETLVEYEFLLDLEKARSNEKKKEDCKE